MHANLILSVFALGSIIALAQPVHAQKSKDTLRFPSFEVDAGIDSYTMSGSFTDFWGPSVYDNLIDFDASAGSFIPHLAKSWTQPDPLTYEFELRDDIKWHDGQPLIADDVVSTLNYLIDPAVKLRYKIRWNWIQSVEKLGPYKVRLKTSVVLPYAFVVLASQTPIYPKHLHGVAADKMAFATRPVGTGPLRITQLDTVTGIVAEKNARYAANHVRQSSGVGRVVSELINDPGVAVASLLTGKVDVAAGLPFDQAESLQASGRFEFSTGPSTLAYTLMTFPAKGWENVKALGDIRVRTAIMKAIDRENLLKLKWGSNKPAPVEALCSKVQLGCGYSKLAPAYDPAGARKLLSEAGYSDGFDLVISTYQINIQDATAIAGMLRAVGIRATVRTHTISQRVQLLNQGKVELGYYAWDGGAMFDVSGPISRHAQTGDYNDASLAKLAETVNTTMNDGARRNVTAKVFDHITDNAYAFVVLPYLPIYTFTKEVKINTSAPREAQLNPHEFTWK